MTTLHEDANVEEAEQAEVSLGAAGVTGPVVGPEAAGSQPQSFLVTSDKCQATSKVQLKEHHLEQPLQPQQPQPNALLTVSDYKITPELA